VDNSTCPGFFFIINDLRDFLAVENPASLVYPEVEQLFPHKK